MVAGAQLAALAINRAELRTSGERFKGTDMDIYYMYI